MISHVQLPTTMLLNEALYYLCTADFALLDPDVSLSGIEHRLASYEALNRHSRLRTITEALEMLASSLSEEELTNLGASPSCVAGGKRRLFNDETELSSTISRRVLESDRVRRLLPMLSSERKPLTAEQTAWKAVLELGQFKLHQAVRYLVSQDQPQGRALADFMVEPNWERRDHPTFLDSYAGDNAHVLFEQSKRAWKATRELLTKKLMSGAIVAYETQRSTECSDGWTRPIPVQRWHVEKADWWRSRFIPNGMRDLDEAIYRKRQRGPSTEIIGAGSSTSRYQVIHISLTALEQHRAQTIDVVDKSSPGTVRWQAPSDSEMKPWCDEQFKNLNRNEYPPKKVFWARVQQRWGKSFPREASDKVWERYVPESMRRRGRRTAQLSEKNPTGQTDK